MTTSQLSTQSHTQQTLFAVDFPAKTSALQASKRVSRKALGLVSFTNSCESFAWYDRSTSSWKTSQQSLLTDWTPFSGNWPRQGLMRSGHVFQQVLWEPATSAIGGGLLPTPTARDHKDSGKNMNYKKAADKGRLPGVVVMQCSAQNGGGTYLNPSFVEEMMGFPVGWTVLKR